MKGSVCQGQIPMTAGLTGNPSRKTTQPNILPPIPARRIQKSANMTGAIGKIMQANTNRLLFSETTQSTWKWIKQEDVIQVAVPIIIMVLLVLVVIFGASFISAALTPIEPTPENLKVSTYERSGIYKFTISDELKVKGSEKVYNVSIANIGTVSLTESEYMKYLGDEANALPVEVYEIEAEVPGAGQKFFQGKRYVFPCSENILPFSEDEKEHFVELICNDSENKSIFLKELSLDYYSFGTHCYLTGKMRKIKKA